MPREPFDDDKFYKYVHDYIYADQERWYNEPDLWIPYESSRLPALFTYAEYCRRYEVAQRERTLLPEQKTRLTEEGFLKVKKRLSDLLTVPDPSSKRLEQQRSLRNQLGLSPFQQYHYPGYLRWLKTMEESGIQPPEPLAERAFLELKRKLLSVQFSQRRTSGPQVEALWQEENRLLKQLFPGAHI